MPVGEVRRKLRAVKRMRRHEHAGAAMTVWQAAVSDGGAREIACALAAIEAFGFTLAAAITDFLRRFGDGGAREC